MAVTFVAAGSIIVSSTVTTISVVAPTLAANDIMIGFLLGKDNIDHSGPAGWVEIGTQVNNTTALTTSMWWKRAVAGDSGASFDFTKATDNNIFFAGVIAAWRGADTASTVVTNCGTPTSSANASSDTVTYASFDPLIACHVIAAGFYSNDLTTAGTISGTDPTLTNRFDLETATGADCSFFGYSGDSTGAATGARSHSTTSSADAVNTGMLFGLEALAANPQLVTPGTASLTLTAFAPTVTATDNKLVTPGTVSLTLTTFVPTVSTTQNQLVIPGTATLTLTTFAPTVEVDSGDILVTPGIASLTLTPFTPVVTATANVLVTPGIATLFLTAFSPTVSVSGGGAGPSEDKVKLSIGGYGGLGYGRSHIRNT